MRIEACHHRADGGYVLLAVIAVSVLVISALATLARLSLRRGLEASDAERSLQQRWGTMTIERTMLQQAPMVFEQQEELLAEQAPGSPTPTTVRAMLRLGDVNFDVLLGDEDAKLNLNAIYHQGGPERIAAAVNRHGGPIGWIGPATPSRGRTDADGSAVTESIVEDRSTAKKRKRNRRLS